MRFLLVYEEGSPEAREIRAERVERVAAALAGFGHEVVEVRGRREAPTNPSGAQTGSRVDLDLARFEGRTALEGVLAECGAEGTVGIGVHAALGLAQVETPIPIWLDLADGLDPVPAGRELGIDGDLEVGAWHRWIWALERADCFTVGDQRELDELRGAIGARGGRLGAAPAPLAILPREAASACPEPLARWLAAPRRRAIGPRILGRAEIADLVELRELEQRAAQPPAWCRRIARRLSRARRATGQGISALAAVAADAPLFLWLSLRAFLLDLAARTRPRPRFATASEAHGPGARLALREARGRRPRLLVVMPYTIFPPRHGGAVRLWNLIPRLAREADVYLMLFHQHGRSEWQTQALEEHCKRVVVHAWEPDVRRRPGRALPKGARLFGNETAAVKVRDLVETEGIDVVQIEYSELGAFRLAAGSARVVLVMHELAWRSLARRRRLARQEEDEVARHYGASLLDQLRMFLFEVDNARRVDEVHFVSEVERARLAPYLPGRLDRLRVVPNGVDVTAFAGTKALDERSGVLFAASFRNAQNVDAVDWFLSDIWPRVRQATPDARLTLVGAGMPEHLLACDGVEGIRALGEVADLGARYRDHRVLVAPLRAGAGTRLKLAEAFAAGAAVVSTTLGAEGLGVENERHLLLADDAESFAAAVVRLLRDDDLATRLARAARAEVERLDWSYVAESNLRSIYRCFDEAGVRPGPDPAPAVSWPAAAESPEVSIVIPIRNGGPLLERVVDRIRHQRTSRRYEIVLVDSGSPEDQRERLRSAGARLVDIAPERFDHGLARDLGARVATGEVLVFLNQDALPAEESWLERLVEPLASVGGPAAVQGGITEFPVGEEGAPPRFFWDSCGPRFYFTSESERWIRRYGGIGFSTVNAAIRRDVWERVPFGWTPILEDKKWQAEVVRRGWRVVEVREAAVFHSHDYALGSLWRRCAAEGLGWRLLGERYPLRSAFADALGSAGWSELRDSLGRREARRAAALLFPIVRPLALWWGNRHGLERAVGGWPA